MSAAKLRIVHSAELSDAEVLARVAAGDLSVLALLYDRYAPALLRYARRVDHEHADDIVQTVFLRVVRIAASFQPTAVSARPWLFAITARVAQEHRRAIRRAATAMLRIAQRADNRTSSTVELRSDMDRGLAALSVAKRSVLLLAEVEGFACEEIAEMLSIPVGTVWTRLHHARRELRAFHEQHGRQP